MNSYLIYALSILPQSISFAIQVTLPSILLLLFGWLLINSKQIDAQFANTASKLVFNWCLPLLLFFAISESEADFSNHIWLIVAGIIVTFLLFFCGELLAKLFIRDKANRGVFVQAIFRGNTAIIGLAFCANALGATGLALGGIFAGTMTILYNILATITLSVSNSTKLSSQSIFKMINPIIRNPLIIGILAGLIYKQSSFILPFTLNQTLLYISKMALPLALICTGASINLKLLFNTADLSIKTSLLRMSLAPIIAFLVAWLMNLDNAAFVVLILMSATPVASASYIMVKNMGGNAVMSANIIGMTTLISILSIPLIIIILSAFKLIQ